MDLEILTQSAIRTFRKCPRLFEIQYEKLYRPLHVAEPLRYGDFWHQIREEWWRAKGETRLLNALQKLSVLRAHHNQEGEEALDDVTLSRLIVMLRGYHERWRDYVDGHEVVAVEESFDIPLINPRTNRQSKSFRVNGAIDALLRDTSGNLWVVEEKTAGEMLEIDSPYWRRLEIDPQVSLYFDAVELKYKQKPVGIKYFVNVKPQQRPLKKTENIKYKKDGSGPYANQRLEDETASEYAVRLAEVVASKPEQFYQMAEVPRLERDIRESQIDLWDTAQAILKAENSGTFLRNPDACIHPFGMACPFLAVCTHRASLDDRMLYRQAKVAHEELTQKLVAEPAIFEEE